MLANKNDLLSSDIDDTSKIIQTQLKRIAKLLQEIGALNVEYQHEHRSEHLSARLEDPKITVDYKGPNFRNCNRASALHMVVPEDEVALNTTAPSRSVAMQRGKKRNLLEDSDEEEEVIETNQNSAEPVTKKPALENFECNYSIANIKELHGVKADSEVMLNSIPENLRIPSQSSATIVTRDRDPLLSISQTNRVAIVNDEWHIDTDFLPPIGINK